MSIDEYLKSPAAQAVRQSLLTPPAAPEVPPAPEGGFRNYAAQIAKGVSLIPSEVKATYVGAMRGAEGAAAPDETNQAAIADAAERQQFARETEQKLGAGFGSQMVQSIPDLGASLGVIPASLAGGAAATAAVAPIAAMSGPAAPAILGAAELAGGAAAAYPLMARADEYRNALALVSQENDKRVAAGGAPFTTEEAKLYLKQYAENLKKSGQWEGGTEAISSAIDAVLLRRLPGGSLLSKAVKTGAGIALSELPMETATSIGQSQALAGTPIAPAKVYDFNKPGDWLEAAKEALPAVLTMAGTTTAVGAGVAKGMTAVQERAKARELGIDRPVLRQRVQDILAFKAANPDVELSTEEVNTYLAGAVKAVGAQAAPQPVVAQQPPPGEQQATPVAPAEVPPVEAQVATPPAVAPAEVPPAEAQVAMPAAETPPIDRTQALRDQTFASLGEGRRAEALRQTEEFKRKQARVETILDKPAEEQTKSDQVFIQRNPEVVNEVSAMRQERTQEQAPVRDLRPEPQGDEGVDIAAARERVMPAEDTPAGLSVAESTQDKVAVTSEFTGRYENTEQHRFSIYKNGKLAGEGSFTLEPDGTAKIGKVTSFAGAGSLGTGNALSVQRELRKQNPQIKKFVGDRVTGAKIANAAAQSPVEPTSTPEQAPLTVAPAEVSSAPKQASQTISQPVQQVSAPSTKTVKAANAVLKADPEAQVEQITSTTGSIYLAVMSQGKTTLFAPDGRQVPGTVSAENAVAKARAEGRISPVSRVTKGKNKGAIKLAEPVVESSVVALNREIGKKVGRQINAYVEVPPPVYLEQVIEPLGKALGKQIVFFRGKDAPMAINGATNVLPDVLFINADSTKPHMQIIGHEFLHNLKVEDIEGYHELVKAVRSVIPEKRFQQYWKAINEKRAAEGAPAMPLAQVEEEVVADVFGDRFMEKEFWNKVEQKNPEGFAGVVQRLIDFIDKVRSAFTGRQGRELDQVREVAAEVLARHIKRHPEAASEVAEEPLPAFADQIDLGAKRNLASYAKALRAGTVTTDLLPKMLLMTPMKTVVDTFIPTMPRLNDLYKAQKALGAVRNEIIDYAGLLHQDLTKMGEKGPGIKAVNNTAALASFNQIWPNKELLEQDWVPANGTDTERLAAAEKAWNRANMDTSTGMSFKQAWQQSKDAYDALGSENLKDAYLRAVESMGELRAREKEALLRLIEQSTVDNPGLREELLNRLELSFSTLKGAYWPLYREGDFILEFMEGETRQVMHFETNFELQQAKATLTEMGVAAETFREDYKRAVQRGEAVLPQQLMAQLSGAVEQSFMAGVDQTDTEAVGRARERSNETLRDMTEIWLRWMPETSALKNSIKRRNVKGFSPNMLRGYLKYMQAHGNRVANLEEGRKVEAILNQIENDIKERRAQGIPVIREGIVLRDLRARAAAQNIQVNKFAQALGKTTSFWYMTSPSIALVQMTQLGVLTFPKLATMFSLPQATTSITKGLQAATSPKYTRKAMFGDDEVTMLFEDMQAVVTSENRQEGQTLGEPLYGVAELRDRINKLQPDQQRLLALRVAMARNLLDISLTHEVNEIAQGGDPNQLHNRVFRGMMSFMRVSETASRKAAILATFDAVTASGQDFFAAMEAVDEVVESTLYNYSKEAKGVLLQGSTARVLLTFQTFRIMTAAKMVTLFKQSFAAESAEVKAAARKELIGIFGMSGLLAGTMGMPMAAILFKLIDAVLGDEDEPLDSEQMFKAWLTENFGQTGADVIAEGPASLLGTALSRRIGLGDVFGSATDMPAHLHGDGAAAWWATQLLGPSYSMLSGWARGYDQMANEGEIMKGLEAAAPKPLKDVLKAYGYATDGLKTGTGKRLMTADEIDANEVLLMALGFQPLEVSRMRDKQYDMQRLGTMLSRRRGQIVQNFVKAYSEGEDIADAMDALQEFNRKNPEFAIGGSDLRRGLKTWQMGDLGVESRREMLLQRRMAQ